MKLLAKGVVAIIFAVVLTPSPAVAREKAEDKWFERNDCKVLDERTQDGDSFGLEWKDEKGKVVQRTYRLYGVDCPESDGKDKRLAKRIDQQAKHWKVDREAVLAAGKEASKFTERLLKRGNVRILTRGKLGQEAPKSRNAPQRRYALVEVEDDEGKRRWLHELLLEAGLARAFGKPAAWPPKEEDRHGENAAEQDFTKTLDRMEERLWRKEK